jgi:hypothetical protein
MTAVTPAEGAEDGLRQFQLVRFNHEQNGGPVHRIMSVMRDGMVELHDMGGYFAPHLFVVADDIGDIPPSPASPNDAQALAEALAQNAKLAAELKDAWAQIEAMTHDHAMDVEAAGEEITSLRAQVAALTAALGVDADVLDLADRLIERGYGTSMPNEWHAAYRSVAETRAALAQSSGDGEHE